MNPNDSDFKGDIVKVFPDGVDNEMLMRALLLIAESNHDRHVEMKKEIKSLKEELAVLKKGQETIDRKVKETFRWVKGNYSGLTVVNENLIRLMDGSADDFVKLFKKLDKVENNLASEIGGVASSVHAKIRTYPV